MCIYAEWLEAKNKRLQFEEKTQSSLQKSIAKELEWTKQQQKGQQVGVLYIQKHVLLLLCIS